MASTVTSQVPAGSLDTSGISISTATPADNNPRAGTIYNPTTLAAAVPLYFHPMYDGRYLMVNSRTWSAATPAGGIGSYSAYTESTAPSWMVVDGPTGATAQVPQFPVIPFKSSPSAATVTAAVSRHPGYLFLLHSATIGGVSQAILQVMGIATSGAITLTAEEVLPPVGSSPVIFDRGLQYADPYLIVYGADSSGTVYTARKPWAKIGVNSTLMPSPQSHAGVGATEVAWSYHTGSGYSPDPAQLAPLVTADGSGLTTAGPMSITTVGSQVLMSTVAYNASPHTYSAQVWSSR